MEGRGMAWVRGPGGAEASMGPASGAARLGQDLPLFLEAICWPAWGFESSDAQELS